MSGEIVDFPAPARERPLPCLLPQALALGDQVLVRINATISLWAAWPVAAVDDDGFVLSVASREGKAFSLHRISCDPTYFGIAASIHDAEAFEGLRWRTWRDFTAGLAAFSAIQLVR